jgi:NAD(P)-dependent dehydrogenase (short-subunit alcohol dehydrogenase family)
MGGASIVPGTSTVDLDLTGRSALVTGAASGIGRACAGRLARAGASVTVLDVDGDAAKKVAEGIGGDALQADLSDYEVLDDLEVDTDIIVNNAGLQHVAPIEEFPPERFSLILRIMLEAPFRILQKALPGMYEKGWGRVINISSVRLEGLAVQVRVRLCQARSGGALQDRCSGGRAQRRHLQLRRPSVRQDAAGGEADSGPGEDTWDLRGRGDREDHAHGARDQTPYRT